MTSESRHTLFVRVACGGIPVAGAPVEAWLEGERHQLQASDANGLTKLTVDAGLRLSLVEVHATEVTVPERKSIEIVTVAGGTTHIELPLKRGVTLSGKVIGLSGDDFHGANVQVGLGTKAWSRALDDPEREVPVAPDGSFRVNDIWGKFALTVTGDSLAVVSGLSGKIDSLGERSGLEVEVTRPEYRDVLVLGAEGAPLPNARITNAAGGTFAGNEKPIAEGVFQSHAMSPSARTDARGQARVGPVPKDGLSVQVSAPGFAIQTKLITQGEDRQTLHLDTGSGISGRVMLPDGGPAGMVNVKCISDASGIVSTVADEEGRYVVSGLAPGSRATVLVHQRGFAISSSPELVMREGTWENVDIALRKAASLRGRVSDSEGLPLEGYQVEVFSPGVIKSSSYSEVSRLRPESLFGLNKQWTDREGKFSFADLPAGAFDLRVYSKTHFHLYHTQAAVAPSATVNVTFPFTESNVPKIRGRVTELLAGNPIQGAKVSVFRRVGSSGLQGVTSVETNLDGRFFVPGLAPGTYQIVGQAPGFQEEFIRTIRLDTGVVSADLELARLVRSAEIRFLRASGAVPEILRYVLEDRLGRTIREGSPAHDQSKLIRNGTRTLTGLPRRPLLLSVFDDQTGDSWTFDLDLTLHREAAFDFWLVGESSRTRYVSFCPVKIQDAAASQVADPKSTAAYIRQLISGDLRCATTEISLCSISSDGSIGASLLIRPEAGKYIITSSVGGIDMEVFVSELPAAPLPIFADTDRVEVRLDGTTLASYSVIKLSSHPGWLDRSQPIMILYSM